MFSCLVCFIYVERCGKLWSAEYSSAIATGDTQNVESLPDKFGPKFDYGPSRSSALPLHFFKEDFMILGFMVFLWVLSVGCYAFGLYWGSKGIIMLIKEYEKKK